MHEGQVLTQVRMHVGLEFTRREIVAKIHIGEATLAKRVTEFATTAAGDLTLEEFDQRGLALESEQMALLESTQPTEEEAAPGCSCIHIGTSACFQQYDNNVFQKCSTSCGAVVPWWPAAILSTAGLQRSGSSKWCASCMA